MQIKLIFTRKVLHLAFFFESEGFWNSEVAYFQRGHGGGGGGAVLARGKLRTCKEQFYVIRLDHLPVAWVIGTCFKTIQSIHVTKTTREFGQK